MSQAAASIPTVTPSPVSGPASPSHTSFDGLVAAGRMGSVFLGVLVLALAVVKASIGWDVGHVLSVANAVFGPVFIGGFALLVGVALVAWVRGQGSETLAEHDPWWQAGLQAASGIATLALTFTLLGISIGIGSLSGTELTPETVPGVISTLTEQFGRAFMTTIVGLPTSHVLRAMLAINASQRQARQMQHNHRAELPAA